LHRAIEQQPDLDSDDDRWPTLWVNFGRKLHSMHEDPPPHDDDEQCDEWVEDIVGEFCRNHKVKQKYLDCSAEGDWGDDE
jgi:hypothetical protein